MRALGAYLVPELWWDPQAGFTHLDALIDDALELGVQAFQVRGGPAAAVRALTDDLHRRAPEPLLIAMEASAGVGSLVPEMTRSRHSAPSPRSATATPSGVRRS